MMRSLVILGVLGLLVPALLARPLKSQGQADLERMKSLEGVWEGKTPDGKPQRISYAIVSAGSTVMETISHGDMASMMVTMYHLDGDQLMMTHYCSLGNQPRMRVVSSTDKTLTFEMFDATNLASEKDAHMRKVTFTWKDKDHITATWVLNKGGKDESHGAFELTRKP